MSRTHTYTAREGYSEDRQAEADLETTGATIGGGSGKRHAWAFGDPGRPIFGSQDCRQYGIVQQVTRLPMGMGTPGPRLAAPAPLFQVRAPMLTLQNAGCTLHGAAGVLRNARAEANPAGGPFLLPFGVAPARSDGG